MLRLVCLGLLLLQLSGCASYGVVQNAPLNTSEAGVGYSFKTWKGQGGRSDELAFILAFSGGGTRAAAFSYGVLEELRDTQVEVGGQSMRLLDQVDRISSVSGGSFTAAYYGLYGERIFEDFESEFLRHDIEGDLFKGLTGNNHL